MKEFFIYLILLIPSALYYLSSILATKGKSIQFVNNVCRVAAFLSLVPIGIFSFLLALDGTIESEFVGINGIGLSFRVDPLNLVMYGMVSIIALVVWKFSKNYLDGDAKHHLFLARFSMIVGSVQLLVISGNLLLFFLFWVLTSLGLQRLLVLYDNRSKAIRSARLKFIVARAADLTLLLSFIMLYNNFGTGNIGSILEQSKDFVSSSFSIKVIAILLAVTAILKSVQFPFHSWILGVLESPTPVSALLHAGLLNAGPFLIIRFSPVMSEATYASVVLLIIGSISALYGSLVYTTQNSVKTGLVYSSIGHMGFSLMMCGMGAYSAAALHFISHSFYKAYSFLNSGSAIEQLKAVNADRFKRSGNPIKLILAFGVASLLFVLLQSLTAELLFLSKQLICVGYFIFIGIVGLYINALDSSNSIRTIIELVLFSALVLLSFYGFEDLISSLLKDQLPALTVIPKEIELTTIGILSLFLIVLLMKVILILPAKDGKWQALRIHIRNGLYLEQLTYRLLMKNVSAK